MATIDLMILGVEKAGTTALFRHLGQSPQVYTHEQREMFYFQWDDEFQKGWDYAVGKYFAKNGDKFIVAKNVMQINSRDALLRLKKQCPEVKCIIMLREPASRAYSAYNYSVLRGAECSATFEEALKLEDERFEQDSAPNNPLLYLRNSTYADKIESANEIFGKQNVLVIYHEEYKLKPRAQLELVEKFIGMNLFEGVELQFKGHNRAAKARFPWLAKLSFRLLRSQSGIKRLLRSMIPHEKATRLRHAFLNFNRIEAPYQAMNEGTAKKIRQKLAGDRQAILDIVGYCPWESNESKLR